MPTSSSKRKRSGGKDDASDSPKQKSHKPNTSARIKSEEPDPPTEIKPRTPTNKAPETVFNNIVFVYVGPSQTKFGVHEGLLRQRSSFFKVALDHVPPQEEANAESITQEDGTKALWLRDEDPVIFKRLNDWLYTAKIVTAGETCKDLSWTLLIDIYTFAERRAIPTLQNSCVDAIIKKCNSGAPFPAQATITNLWKCHGAVWPLRRLILHRFAAKCDLKAALLSNSAYPQRFLHDLVIILYESKFKTEEDHKENFWAARKQYYVHTLENPISVD